MNFILFFLHLKNWVRPFNETESQAVYLSDSLPKFVSIIIGATCHHYTPLLLLDNDAATSEFTRPHNTQSPPNPLLNIPITRTCESGAVFYC